MSSSAEQELRNAFDRFSLWILMRHAATSATMHLMWCKTIQAHLHNYMLAVMTDRIPGAKELVLLEHYLTKKQFEEVPKSARKAATNCILNFLDIPPETAVHHYVHLFNECPQVEVENAEIKILHSRDMIIPSLWSIPSRVLCVISVARELEDADDRNVYEICLSNGQTIRKELLRSAETEKFDVAYETPFDRPYYPVDAHPMNGISLEDIGSELRASRTAGQLFLVRQAELEDIRRYIKRNCVDRLEDVTADTSFLISETVPFETTFQEHTSVHEVAHLRHYGVIFWLRSRGAPTLLGKHFTLSFRAQSEAVPPAPCWLNVLVSNETNGSSTYLKNLATLSRKTDPFRMVAVLQANDMIDILRQQNVSTTDKLCNFFGARSHPERFVVARGQLLLLVDHAMDDILAKELVDFVNTLDGISQRLTVWIVGDDYLWTHFTTHCKHPAIKHTMPRLNEEERNECLSMLREEGAPEVETIVRQVRECNSKKEAFVLPGNVFFLVALADGINSAVRGQESGPLSYWWIDVMERFLWKYIAPEESSEMNDLKQNCYNQFVSVPEARWPISLGCRFEHRTLLKVLAAKYLVEHPHMIDVKKYRLFGRELIDLLLFRLSPPAIAVIQHDIETIRLTHTKSPDTLVTAADCLQRNLLHVANDSRELGKLLLSYGVALEQQCPQLNNWTPLQAADDREDWPLVDGLLEKGADTADKELKLRQMDLPELRKVFSDCISYNCKFLIDWILKHRTDYRINQEDLYCLSVYQEFDRDLLVRLLTLAEEQRLPEREPEPYQFIWNNNALDNAVDDERYELAAFLVERLNFAPTENYFKLQKMHMQLKGYKRLFEMCTSGELDEACRLMEEKALDPFFQYRGSNIFIHAAASNNLGMLRHLFEKYEFSERLNDPDEHGCTAMSAAIERGCTSIVSFLHECGATVEPSMIKSHANTLPIEAITIDTEDFQSLISLQQDRLERLNIDYQRFEEGELLLHHYIFYVDEPDEGTFRYLLAQYDDVDVRTSLTPVCRNGETPLHIALRSGNKRCIQMLLEAGANVHAKSLRHGLTSLHYAIMGCVDRAMLTCIIEQHGIDVNTRDERGRSITFYMPPDRRLYRWLIQRYGLDVNRCDKAGRTILHYRVIQNNFFVREEVEFLLRVLQFHQARTDERGRLPLHYAVEAGNLEIVRLLMKYRSDLLDVPDGDGLTAVQLATKKGHAMIGEMFSNISKHRVL